MMNLILKFCGPVRLLMDGVFVMLLITLFLPVMELQKPGASLDLFQTTLQQTLIGDLSSSFAVSLLTVFGGLTLAWMTRHHWSHRALIMPGLILLISLPDFMHTLLGASLIGSSPHPEAYSAFLLPLALSCLIGWSIAGSISMSVETSTRSFGASAIGLFKSLYLPRVITPGLALSLFMTPFLLVQGFTLTTLATLSEPTLVWHLVGPKQLLANSFVTHITYLLFLTFCLIGGKILCFSLSPAKSAVRSFGGKVTATGPKKTVTRKKRKKRKSRKPEENAQ